MAFQDYKPYKTFSQQDWVGFKWFVELFKQKEFLLSLRNTVGMSLISTALGYITAIILAVFMNEVRFISVKRFVQTVSYLPHFLSWVIVTGLVANVLVGDKTGILNSILLGLHLVDEPVQFLAKQSYFWHIIGWTYVWKEVGWNTIVYLGAMTAIDPCLYEAAQIDGASSLRQFFSITVPLLSPTTFFIVQTRIIGALTVFDLMFMVMDKTNLALNKTQSIVYLFYTYAFTNGNRGYGAAIVMVLVVFIMIVTFFLQKLEKKIVYYN